MFITVKALTQRIENELFYMTVNMDMLDGKIDNPNNYSRDYILGVVSEQCKIMHNLISELNRISTNTKLIKKYEVKAQGVVDRFSTI